MQTGTLSGNQFRRRKTKFKPPVHGLKSNIWWILPVIESLSKQTHQLTPIYTCIHTHTHTRTHTYTYIYIYILLFVHECLITEEVFAFKMISPNVFRIWEVVKKIAVVVFFRFCSCVSLNDRAVLGVRSATQHATSAASVRCFPVPTPTL